MKWYPMVNMATGKVEWMQLGLLHRHCTRDDLYVDEHGGVWRPYWVNHHWVGRKSPPSRAKKAVLWALVSALVPGCLILTAVLSNEEMAHWGYAVIASIMFITISLAIAWKEEIV